MYSQAWKSKAFASFLALVISMGLACERNTVLKIEGGNPPKFVMSGNGILGGLMVRGPKKQREAEGEDALIYWRIRNLRDEAVRVEEIGAIIYGTVPEGYRQIYPENGTAPPLIDGEKYYIRVDTSEANGAQKYFTLQNGIIKEVEITN
jgi:hypothetical protein